MNKGGASMRAKKKCLSRWYTVRIFAVALGFALLMAACETQSPQTPTATRIPPTATGTPEPTSTSTPVPTASNTPTPEAPQAISNFVDNLPGEFL
jgi:predicted cobalt transporter CbtA